MQHQQSSTLEPIGEGRYKALFIDRPMIISRLPDSDHFVTRPLWPFAGWWSRPVFVTTTPQQADGLLSCVADVLRAPAEPDSGGFINYDGNFPTALGELYFRISQAPYEDYPGYRPWRATVRVPYFANMAFVWSHARGTLALLAAFQNLTEFVQEMKHEKAL